MLGTHQDNTLAGALKRSHKRLNNLVRSALGHANDSATLAPSTLWALRDITLSIGRGEIVGIVGRNGNGKSTLLKILSRITMPTHGRVRLHGSLASLLEVGTGFHPELTGRENIFLNGAILGMSRKQIRQRLDAIVAFSEVDRFLDTPVKRYSSGMYVRLAFAVAAHLEPDILLVDEVLAVGDGAFQKKCLGKMQDVGNSERTVLFVSHTLPAVRSICSRVILLDQGRIAMDGPTDQVLAAYNKLLQAPRKLTNDGISWRLLHSNGFVRVSTLTCLDSSGKEKWSFKQGQDVKLRLEYEVFEAVKSLGLHIVFTSLQSGEVVTTYTAAVTNSPLQKGETGSIDLVFPKIPLRAGEYAFTLALGDAQMDRKFDYLDAHQNLPWLGISSDEDQKARAEGYFSIPAGIENVEKHSI